ncbi:MAG: glycoside hydrolase family 2 TIM barrel-domain containing protein [Prevotellaceae bacterium]|nr:glycoside hydrolase family 2 TIM barrel-domain containing protein [Prevotellaceae bacterium]
MKRVISILLVLMSMAHLYGADNQRSVKLQELNVLEDTHGYGADSQRTVTSLNFGWRFHAGDIAGAEALGFDDSGWQTINVPHDFQISQPWIPPSKDEKADNSDAASNVKSRLSSRGFKEMGIGWYRKTINPDASWKDKRVIIDFEGIMLVGDVYLNGERIGGTDYGYIGFDIDISKLLKYGQDNVIAVKANTQKPENSRWYTGGGLFRDVNLIITDAQQYFTRNPLYITTPVANETKAVIMVQAEMACYEKVENLNVNTKIIDAAGNVVYDKTNQLPYNRGQKINEYKVDSIVIDNPNLWSCETPYLYEAKLTLLRQDGTVADQVNEKFGVRTIEYSPSFGFKLNGKKVILKGIANHHTLGALGAAAYPRAMEKRIQMLKEFGFNHVRTSHNPYSKSFLDLCDKYGMLVVDELYDKWLTKFAGGRIEWENLWQHDIPEFIRRDRNHPSVVMWSLGNELQTYWNIPYADWGVTPYRMQKVLLNRYDTTRPVTVAMHPRGRNLQTDSLPAPLVHETDIAAYNYRYMYFPGDSKRFPNMIFYQSEANTAMMGPNYYEMNLDKVVGLAYWGMIDYLGESNGWPAKGWAHGVFDISLEPKPMAYFLRSIFKEEEPLVHIGIIDSDDNTVWNDVKVGTESISEHWNRKAGSTLSLYTYTNADEVELFVNGKSIGKKVNDKDNPKQRNRIKWDNVKYEAGKIEAVAYNNGSVVARHKIETTGDAVALKAEADNQNWSADGMDLQHVRIVAVDKKGRRDYGARQKLTFSVSGPAEIVGVINGDITSDELSVGNTRCLYNGTATVILRSKQEPGKVVLTTSTDGMKAVKTQLTVK